MQNQIVVAIEGSDAALALEELLAISGVVGTISSSTDSTYRDAGVLVAVGAIVGIASGVASVVSALIEWRRKWLERGKGEVINAVIEDGRGNRILLQSATPEQLTRVLESVKSEGGK